MPPRALVLLLLLGSARALELSPDDLSLRLRAAPEGSWANRESPFDAASGITGIGSERGRAEVEVRLRKEGLTAAGSVRFAPLQGSVPVSQGVLSELFYDAEVLGQHLTAGKKVMSWDVGFGFRPLDVIQHEDRRAFLPFALEGVPLLAWELFGADSAWTLVWANPLRGRAPAPRDNESVAVKHYRRFGSLDLHLLARWSERSAVEGGLAASVVLGDAVELHGSSLYQRRFEKRIDSLVNTPGLPLAESDPTVVRVSPDGLSGLLGFTLTPGWNLSFLGEAWFDPTGSTAAEWAAMGALARRQLRLLGTPAPRDAVVANLAFGARLFDRPSLLRENLLLRASWKWERLEPALDLLYTPEDGGFVVTATVSWEGERSRLAAGLRTYGGRRDSAYRLFPLAASCYASWELHF